MKWPIAVIKMRSRIEALLVWSAASSRRFGIGWKPHLRNSLIATPSHTKAVTSHSTPNLRERLRKARRQSNPGLWKERKLAEYATSEHEIA